MTAQYYTCNLARLIKKNIGSIISLTISILLLFGLAIFSWYISGSQCLITEINNRNCYEHQANIWLEQYVTVVYGTNTGMYNKQFNVSAFTNCGKVLNCLTSPCNIDISVGKQYWCLPYNDNLTQISDGIPAFFIIVMILSSAFSVICFMISYATYCKNKSDENNENNKVEIDLKLM